jgi:hypothetical protein
MHLGNVGSNGAAESVVGAELAGDGRSRIQRTGKSQVQGKRQSRESSMNGAQSLFKALVDAGITTCFANPGTSEMQLVYEIGMTDKVRPVLCLQEDVVTGAADGYQSFSFEFQQWVGIDKTQIEHSEPGLPSKGDV